jgi:hypothetical protein
MSNFDDNNTQALIEAVKELGDVGTTVLEDASADKTIGHAVTILEVPTSRKLESVKKFLDEYRTRPERKQGTSDLTTVASFVDQVNRSKDEDTVVFVEIGNRQQPSMTAVFDYNKAGPDGEPRFGRHRARYRFPVSVEWAAWTGAPGKLEGMAQDTFAEFLETRIMDVLDPTSIKEKGNLDAFCRQLGITLASPGRLMELSKGLTVHAEHTVIQNILIGSGEMQLAFTEDHKDSTGAKLKVPGGFAIAIPVFLHGPAYQIPVRLRYRVKDGVVKWTLAPQRLDEVWDDAITMSVNDVTTKTSLTTLFGTPEER